jgi:hypothetical protein
MLESLGIYETNNQNSLIFLRSQNFVGKDTLSSLQSFETSLIMIALGRWTNAVIGVTTAIETQMRSYVGFDTEIDFKPLINEFSSKIDFTVSLKNAAHRVREGRNVFIHSSVIPEDNKDAILLYMNDALSVFKVVIEKTKNINIYEEFQNDQISKNLQFVKNLIKSKKDTDNVSYDMAVLVKTLANYMHEMLTPRLLSNLPDERVSDSAYRLMREWQSDFEDWHDEDFIHNLVACPAICSGQLSVGFEVDQEYEDFISNPVGLAYCPKCGLSILPKELLNEYVIKKIGSEKMSNIFRSYGLSP